MIHNNSSCLTLIKPLIHQTTNDKLLKLMISLVIPWWIPWLIPGWCNCRGTPSPGRESAPAIQGLPRWSGRSERFHDVVPCVCWAGSLCVEVADVDGCSCISLVVVGFCWLSVVVVDYCWLSMVIVDYCWFCLLIVGCCWWLLVPWYVPPWQCVSMPMS